MKELDEFIVAQKKVLDHFGCSLTDMLFNDLTDAWWAADDASVFWWFDEEDTNPDDADYGEDVYGYGRHNKHIKAIYEGSEFSAIPIVDGCGNDPYLGIFDNSKRKPCE